MNKDPASQVDELDPTLDSFWSDRGDFHGTL